MSTPPAFAAELLRASQRALAGAATSHLFENNPELAARYGGDAFEAWRAHLGAQLGDLAVAVEEQDPAVFVRQLHWFRSAVESRLLPVDDLGAALEALEASLRERLPQVDPGLWGETFASAREALRAAPPGQPPTVESGSPAHSFLDATLRGESRVARALAVDLVSRGALTAEALVEDVLLPVQREAGRRWHVGEIGIAEEHVVTSTVRAALADLAAGAPVPDSDAPGVLIGAVSGDAHDIALHALASLLEYDGWRASVAGADTPAPDLARAARLLGADLVVLSATLVSQRHALRAALVELRAEPEFSLPLLVGGAAVPDAKTASALGADGFAATLAGAVIEADRLIERS